MGRLEFLEIALNGGIADDKISGVVAAVMPLGTSGFHMGTGIGWDHKYRTGTAQLSSSYVLRGDPIGFMEGLFGPSITTGVSVRYTYADSVEEHSFDTDAGFQFSLFPSFALGMNYTDIINDPELVTGFSHVFNKNMKTHVSFTDSDWNIGCELMITRALQVYSGTNGDLVNAGFKFSWEQWNCSYGSILHRNAVEYKFGVSRRFS